MWDVLEQSHLQVAGIGDKLGAIHSPVLLPHPFEYTCSSMMIDRAVAHVQLS